MSAEQEQRLEEFARRTRELLQESVANLDGATRSRLTRARYAALAGAGVGVGAGGGRALAASWQRWLPAGAIAAAVLAVLIVVGQQSNAPTLQANAGGVGDDIELLADADALALAQEADVDYDFYEWAVYAAQDGDRGGVGT
jgi:hypothetical protein